MIGKQKRARARRKLLRRTGVCLALAVVAFHVLSLLFPFPEAKLETLRREREAVLVQDREGNLLRPFLSADESWLFWASRDEISPRLVEAIIAVEDERFRIHPGVDPIAIVRAAWSNFRRGRIVSGASTLTMQVVRMQDPRPRTYTTKAAEAFRALQLERLRSKDRLLEIYLNLAPFGGNLVGVEAASLSYFRKHAKDLTLGEAALLAGLVQSPTRLRPDRHPERARQRRDHVLERMKICGYISKEQLTVALKEPVWVKRNRFPFEAPHFARMVFRRHTGVPVLRTTLDGHIQQVAETALREQVDSLRPAGVTNGAVVVVENPTAAVRALVGSCDFFSIEDCGQINGPTAARSPGSAVKPFTYALAFERGVACPSTVLADVPRNFTGYEPENYDHRHRGPVTARQALAHSLNVPAVDLLREVGLGRLHALLKECGLSTLTREADHYGLALTLGSAEARLLELTNAYAALARLGMYKPYRLLEDEPLRRGRQVLSSGAAYLVADVLSDMKRLGGACLWKSERSQIRMAWKTGTSYGHRDAWTIAYTPEYTVGVWLGNFSGEPSRALVGIEAAAPVAARIMDQIHADKTSTWYVRPESVGVHDVCAASGMPIGEHCPLSSRALYLRNRSTTKPCTIHVAARIDDETGGCLCHLCSRGRRHTVKVVEDWPLALAAWFRHQGITRPLMPAHFSGCRAVCDQGSRPRIFAPGDGQSYILAEDDGGNQKLLFQASAATERIHWFVDGTLYKTCPASERLFWPLRRGEHVIACADDSGRSTSVRIDVQ